MICKNRNNKCKVGEGEFRIVVPKRDNSGKPISTNVIKRYGQKVNKIFGGSTIIPNTKGCYSPPGEKEFFCEDSMMIIGVRDFENPYTKPSKKNYNTNQKKKQLDEDYMKVKSLGRKMSKELGQDAIFVEYSPLVDASMVKKKKSWKAGLKPSKLSDKEIFQD